MARHMLQHEMQWCITLPINRVNICLDKKEDRGENLLVAPVYVSIRATTEHI